MIAGTPDEGSRLTHPLIRAGLTIGARRVASRVWRIMTGEEPPTKK